MDIRELRIEDRVSHNGDIGEVVEIKTNHVRLLFKDDTSYLYNVNELDPIPLTDELLKKIGFTPMGDSRFALTDAALLKYDAINYMFVTRYTHKLIKYIHQLQYELFDAGIELKIEL